MLKSLPLALAASLSLFAAGAALADGVEGAVDGATGSYTVEANHTEVVFSLSHFGFTTYYGQFPGATGTLTLDAKDPSKSQVDVSIPVASVLTASTKLNGEIASAMFLDGDKFPNATFHSTKVVVTGKSTADVIGDLTLHGVTKPVVLHAHFNKAGDNPMMKTFFSGFDATGKIKRSDFGVMTYLGPIGDEVTLTISASFAKKPS